MLNSDRIQINPIGGLYPYEEMSILLASILFLVALCLLATLVLLALRVILDVVGHRPANATQQESPSPVPDASEGVQ